MSSVMKDFKDKDIIKAIKELISAVTVCCDYDIPYLAGYSIDGSVIYIDRHIPKEIKIGSKKVPIFDKLIMHEMVEKAIEDKYHIGYLFAHQIALRAEAALCEADGVEWNDYEDAMEVYIKKADKEELKIVPDDLDLKPYEDEDDYENLKEIFNAEQNKEG